MYSAFKAYYDSKLCQILSTKFLNSRLSETNVNIYAVHPGVIPTDLYKSLHIFGKIAQLLKCFFRVLSAYILIIKDNHAFIYLKKFNNDNLLIIAPQNILILERWEWRRWSDVRRNFPWSTKPWRLLHFEHECSKPQPSCWRSPSAKTIMGLVSKLYWKKVAC